MMAAQEHEVTMTEAQKESENPVEIEDLELVETPPTMPTEEHDKKWPGPINSIQAAKFVCKTNISLNKFVNTIQLRALRALYSIQDTHCRVLQ